MDPYLAPDNLLAAYASGMFPMADETGEIHWLAPDPRAVIDLDAMRVPRSLSSVRRRGVFHVTVDARFGEVLAACADRPEGTWISEDIKRAYATLHDLGFAHSVEVWRGACLAGGLYGVALGGAFFGESMFHRESDASKIALVHLVERMRQRSMVLLDVQFITEHLRRFGAVEIPRAEYQRRLHRALEVNCAFADPPAAAKPDQRDDND